MQRVALPVKTERRSLNNAVPTVYARITTEIKCFS